MQLRSKSIHVNQMPAGIREGIYISRHSDHGQPNDKAVDRPHRDNGHVFILQEAGTTQIEIDFVVYAIEPGSMIYINPSQVHRLIAFEHATISSWIITNENLRPEFLKMLEALVPANNLNLTPAALRMIKDTVTLSLQFLENKHQNLFDVILKESLNTLVALIIAQYLAVSKISDSNTRPDLLSKAFKALLEEKFTIIKSPADYANSLHISAPYLNECVKSSTGQSLTYHIKQRIVLEAKRLLYHSSSSVKEIAVALGYDDYSYFNRLFVKVTGITPLAFRKQNCE